MAKKGSSKKRSSKKGSTIYDILVFSFAGTQAAGEVVEELKSGQKLGGYKVVAEAVVVREADGSVKVPLDRRSCCPLHQSQQDIALA